MWLVKFSKDGAVHENLLDLGVYHSNNKLLSAAKSFLDNRFGKNQAKLLRVKSVGGRFESSFPPPFTGL